MTIQDLQFLSWKTAEEKGFHEGRAGSRDDALVRICLIHTEASEAAQLVKRRWPQDTNVLSEEFRNELAEELADILIRVGDLAECCMLDLDKAVKLKMAKNAGRNRLYGTPNEEHKS